MNSCLTSRASVFLLISAFIPLGNLRAAETSATNPAPTLPAQFQATVYEVQLPTNHNGKLEAPALASKAGTAEDLLKALGKAGTARILYRVDQPVNVYSERITLGSREPVVTGARKTTTGTTLKTVQYQNVGVIIHLKAQPPATTETKRKEPDVDMNIELSALTPGDIEIAPGVKAPVTRTVAIEHREPLKFGKPQIMLSIDTSKEGAVPTAYVIRYLFKSPGK
jgi:hypothetical protein